jgi:hypothetical protein
MMSAAPEDATFQDVIADVFDVAIVGDNRMMARNVPAERVREVHQLLLAQEGSSTTVDIGEMGEDAFDGYYRRVQGIAEINSARIPFCVECWAEAESIEKGEDASSLFYPLINRSAALSYLWCNSDSIGLNISGCGLSFKVGGPKRAEYGITLSVITPYVRLMNDGKTPYLADFGDAIEKAVKGAAGEAYRNLIRPSASMSIKDAAYSVMEEARRKVSMSCGGLRVSPSATIWRSCQQRG